MSIRRLLLIVVCCAVAGLAQADDRPGQKHHVQVKDLPAPFASKSAKNRPEVVKAPQDAKLQVPAGFEVSLYAEGFRNPRHLETAPNGDLFVTESEADEVRVLRDRDGDGKPDENKVFISGLKRPFGVAFYPPGPEPRHLYIANTDGVIRVPYAKGQLEASAKPEKIAELSSGGQLRAADTGRAISPSRRMGSSSSPPSARSRTWMTIRWRMSAREFS